MPKGTYTKIALFNKIHDNKKRKYNLKTDFRYPYSSMRSRIRRNQLKGNGKESPLKPIEKKILVLIKCMNNIKHSLSLTDGIDLVNDLIHNTPIQQRLIDWKISKNIYHKDMSQLGKIGYAYFKFFLKRYKNHIREKSISKYAIDRSNFTNFLNFSDMYDHIQEIMIKSKVAKLLPEPVSMDIQGNIVDDEKKGYGYKVPIEIVRPDLCLVLDECGCNISQEGDGRVGQEKFLAGVNDKAYSSIATKDSHFTHIGITLLNGDALMCVVIVSGKQHDILVELGLDMEKLLEADIDLSNLNEDEKEEKLLELLEGNCGDGKIFPGIPSCTYKGKEVPGYVAFSESGGITPTILTNIFRKLDHLQLFDEDRQKGFVPFVLLDGHGSRFGLEFLEYINNESHLWHVCLGVPYGTAFWQIADSPQLNGFFKILMTKAKRDLFAKRIASCLQDMHLLRTDIIPLVRLCWYLSFGNKTSILKAIAERGWGPYNRVLLLVHSVIRGSMTEEMIEKEKKSNLFPKERLSHLHSIHYEQTNENVVELRHANDKDDPLTVINLDGGCTSRYVTTTIVTDNDRQLARERSIIIVIIIIMIIY